MNRFGQKVIIVSRNLDGFSLVNEGLFTKFAKLSCYMAVAFLDELLAHA